MEIKIENIIKEKQRFTEPASVALMLREVLAMEEELDQAKEHFWVLGFNQAQNVQYVELVTLGILNACICHPREIFRKAIISGVSHIIIAHNHPSDNTTPSEEDKKITKNLRWAGQIIGIKVVDSIIVGKTGHFSFHESGLEGDK